MTRCDHPLSDTSATLISFRGSDKIILVNNVMKTVYSTYENVTINQNQNYYAKYIHADDNSKSSYNNYFVLFHEPTSVNAFLFQGRTNNAVDT